MCVMYLYIYRASVSKCKGNFCTAAPCAVTHKYSVYSSVNNEIGFLSQSAGVLLYVWCAAVACGLIFLSATVRKSVTVYAFVCVKTSMYA